MTRPHLKPVALLRLMAARKGERITARDAVALQLAARVIEEQAEQIDKHVQVYGQVLWDLVTEKSRADALTDAMRAALEVVNG